MPGSGEWGAAAERPVPTPRSLLPTPSGLFVPLRRPPLQDDLAGDDHVADDAPADVGELAAPVAKRVVRDDRGAELLRERQDEVVGVRTRRRLLQLPLVDEPLVALDVVNLVAERGVYDDDGLEALGGKSVA